MSKNLKRKTIHGQRQEQGEKRISRRELLQATAIGLGAAAAPGMGCDSAGVNPRKMDRRVIILGFDAVSPWLLKRYMDQGHLPNMKALAEQGFLKPLK
ncbi:MAG: hypothetical protein U9P14_00375, partial [Gemmatimonadota bacterium]|nr:hypothetical protein [Gemmatimonadota bacterium]